jgi:hypothetical protein
VTTLLPGGERPHLILGSDICYSQGRGEMQMLVDTIAVGLCTLNQVDP